jgi:Zn-dependent M16 (insulinase) family peptidase
MDALSNSNDAGLHVGDVVHDYRLQRVEQLKEIAAVFYELEHLPTGAKHVHIGKSDSENTFSVAFKTVPSDSTGVAHILEHTVLCGSAKYPVRDPFFSMLKRSLSTFMNAFTSSDWTMYPFSTQNRKDYYNLMDVYLDAAFFPKLERLSFRQEGHRLEIETNPESPNPRQFHLAYKGVVYNEMKGAMSSPDQVMIRSIMKALYPSTTYRFNSGGEPAEIPSLSYEQLLEFHRRHYHPSNAFFYTYGNLPLTDHLAVIAEKVLKQFNRIDPQTGVPSQPRWQSPQSVAYSYPFSKNEDPSKKSQACVAWLTADIRDAFEVLTLTLLEQILLGNSASPLRKALIDSGLGSALCDGSGYDADNRDTLFVSGLKDVDQAAAGKIETIVFDVFRDLVEHGIDKELIESAIHQIEFHRKEITNSPYPYGIKLLLTFGASWFHGGDPVHILNFDADLAKLRGELAKGPFLEHQIKKYFLDNPHRILLRMIPDQEMEQKQTRHQEAELDRIKKDLSPADIDQLKRDAEVLRHLQETEEDVACLPTLQRADIPPSVPMVKESAADVDLGATIYQQATSGIFYFAAAAGAGALPNRLLPLTPFFCHAFSKMGTRRRDYVEMARRIDAYTGGIGLSTHSRVRFDDAGDCLPFISFAGKCLRRNLQPMFDIIQELLHQFDFTDLTRLKNLLLEYRAGLESMVVHNGHRLAISLAARNFSSTRNLSEIWSGVHQLQTVKRLTENLNDESLRLLSQDLVTIGGTLFNQKNLQMALIGEDSAQPDARSYAAAFLGGFERGNGKGFVAPDIRVVDATIREGWSTSSAVSFVALAFQTVRLEHADAAVLAVISKILRSMYLHREIREKGGAYGGFASYNPEDGLFSFASYRDPHIVSTLDVFENAAAFIRSGNYRDEDVNEAILQVCSEIDKPDPPGPAAKKAFYRKIVSLSDGMRGLFKSRLLSVTRHQVAQAAQRYFHDEGTQKAVAVISGEEKLKAANHKLGDRPLQLHRI